jgi:hypothetical protein
MGEVESRLGQVVRGICEVSMPGGSSDIQYADGVIGEDVLWGWLAGLVRSARRELLGVVSFEANAEIREDPGLALHVFVFEGAPPQPPSPVYSV